MGPGTTPNDDALRERWFEMVRAAKGIEPETKRQPDPLRKNGPVVRTQMKPPEEPDAGAEPLRTRVREGTNGHTRFGLMGERTPTLALKAMFLMSQGTDKSMEEVLDVGEDILRLELASLPGDE
jgi:hypothetical protein